jgi:uncharacterized membrane protein
MRKRIASRGRPASGRRTGDAALSDEPRVHPAESSTSERETHSLPLGRFTAFCDGVVAIAITLLVLELAVPHESVRLLAALREQWPELLGHCISFAFIGGLWIVHSGITNNMRRGDPASYALKLVLLLASLVLSLLILYLVETTLLLVLPFLSLRRCPRRAT